MSARELGLGETDRPPETARDLLVRIAFHFVQPNDRARGWRQARQRPLDIEALLTRRSGSKQCRGMSLRILGTHALKSQPCALPRRAQEHEAFRDGDLPQPGTEGCLPAILRQALVQGHHRVLEQVLSDRPVAHEPADQRERR